ARRAAHRAVQWVVQTQRTDGGWAPRAVRSGRAFDTALALAIMTFHMRTTGVREALVRAIDLLCEMQLPSGRWPSAPMLRIPPPEVRNPDRYRAWRSEGLGTGVVISDQ